MSSSSSRRWVLSLWKHTWRLGIILAGSLCLWLLYACWPRPLKLALGTKVYLPLVQHAEYVNEKYAVNWGWDGACCEGQETSLGLVLHEGGHQQYANDWNGMVSILTQTWYDGWGKPRDVCTYDKVSGQFFDWPSCEAWVKSHLGRDYVIGNEPNCGKECSGDALTPEEYAFFFHNAFLMIHAADPTAKFITGAWIYGNPCTQWDQYDGAVLRAYKENFGSDLPTTYFGLHRYHSLFSGQSDREFVKCFLDRIPGPVVVTETGWTGLEAVPISADQVVAFMQDFLPWLVEQPKIVRVHWWQWGENSYFFEGDQLAPAGRCYQALAHGRSCP